MKRTFDGEIKPKTYRIEAHIYVYECIDSNKKYVGQSRQEEGVRQYAHMKQDSKFDKLLQKNPTGFKHQIVERSKFECVLSTNDMEKRRSEKARVLSDAQVWMNSREEYYIAYYDSYHNGFNRTKGGQLGRDQAFYEAWLLDREVAWNKRIRALTLYKKMHGDLLVPALYRLEEKVVKKHGMSLDADLNGFRLGYVVRNIRNDHIIVDPENMRCLTMLDFVWDVRLYQRERMWRGIYAYHKKHGHLRVPGTYRINKELTDDKTIHGYGLGATIGAIRNGWKNASKKGRQTTPAEKKTLIELGFVLDMIKYDRERLWRGLRAFHSIFGHLDVPTNFRFTDDNTDDKSLYGLNLKNAITMIRSYKKKGKGGIIMSDDEHQTLSNMGMVWEVMTAIRELLWRALEAFHSENGHLRVPLDYIFPRNHKDPNLQGYTLGCRINHIRQNHIKMTEMEKERLNGLGFVWDMNQYNREIMWRALRAFYKEHGHLNVPLNTILPTSTDDVLIQGYKLGFAVGGIRQKSILMSNAEMQQLKNMQFVWDGNKHTRDILWSALQEFYDEHKHLVVPTSFAFPSDHPRESMRSYNLGCAVVNIRSGGTKMSESEITKLDSMGFKWNLNKRRKKN